MFKNAAGECKSDTISSDRHRDFSSGVMILTGPGKDRSFDMDQMELECLDQLGHNGLRGFRLHIRA